MRGNDDVDYVYRLNIRPEAGFSLELRVTARSVAVARREVRRFLVDHEGDSWAIESVSRETTRAHSEAPMRMPGS